MKNENEEENFAEGKIKFKKKNKNNMILYT